ncbi:21684_t:CDS:2, partial [Dentiscutata erythropus]
MSANSQQSTNKQILHWNYYRNMGKSLGFMGRSSDIAGNSHKVVKENEYEEEDFSKKKEYMELVIRKIKERNLSLMDAIDNVLDNAENKEERSAKIEILIPFSKDYNVFITEYES